MFLKREIKLRQVSAMSSVQGCHGFFTYKRNYATPSWCWPFSPAANHEKYVCLNQHVDFCPSTFGIKLTNIFATHRLKPLRPTDQQTSTPVPRCTRWTTRPVFHPRKTRIFGVVVTSPCGGEGNSECTKSKTFSFALLVSWEFKVTPPCQGHTPQEVAGPKCSAFFFGKPMVNSGGGVP